MPEQCCVNPSARCYEGNGFDISASFLWWKSEQSDLPFAFVNTRDNDEGDQNDGFLDYINFSWQPGFRIETCWKTNYDGWNLSANYTWMHNESKGHCGKVTNPEFGLSQLADYRGVHFPYPVVNTIVIDGHSTQLYNLGLLSASAKWKMQYNMFDMQLSKPYLVSQKLALTPFIGGLGGWIKRDLSTVLDNNPFSDALLVLNYKSNYWGIGPRLGFNSDWKVGSGFEFFGNMASALLYGASYDEHVTSVGFVEGVVVEPSSLNCDIIRKKSKGRVVPAIQMMLGLGWNVRWLA